MLKFIDLFAGIGGIRLGFEQACSEAGIKTKCVLTSEIKPHAIKTLEHNFRKEKIHGDIFKIKNEDIPDFDFLFGGFPCQPFSSGGKRKGFLDTRGTLFFEIERILRSKKPLGFILENVEGLVKHDLENKLDDIGQTLKTILFTLEKDLGYKVTWKVLDSKDFGIPQSRKRIFIVGTKNHKINISDFISIRKPLKGFLESGKPLLKSDFTKKLLSKYKPQDLYGKSIKDKRGGDNNIHSWDIGTKGKCSDIQTELLNELLKQRRKKIWAEKIGIKWMDGMPLTYDQISTFFNPNNLFRVIDLKSELDDLVKKGYLKFEHPKKIIRKKTELGFINEREFDLSKPKGYNIVTGKLSFEINKILDPNDIAPTLVATDMIKLGVVDNKGLRTLTIREGLRLSGYPEEFDLPLNKNKAFDLLGNTVVVPVIKYISSKIIKEIK